MAMKQEIILWDEAVKAHDIGDLETSLRTFNEIADTSRILFNCGVIHASLGEHAEAVSLYNRAVGRDQYLAVAYFQCGVSNFLLGEFEDALANFNDTIICLRGNAHIDYDQLGLKYKLHSCEAIFNRGLCYIYLQQKGLGMQDLRTASATKMTAEHNVIDEAIEEEANGFVVFSIPRGIIYRPNAAKVKNLTSKDYLGKARLIAAQQERQNQLNRPGMHSRNQSETTLTTMNPAREQMFSDVRANVAKSDLSFRSRQQSEPPLRRTAFPPTPPPDEVVYRSASSEVKRKSTSSSSERSVTISQEHRVKTKPLKLDLGAAAFNSASQERLVSKPEKLRLGTVRSASEQPRARMESSFSSSGREPRERREISRRSLRLDTRDPGEMLSPDVYNAVQQPREQQQQCQYQRSEEAYQQQQSAQPSLLQPVNYHQQRSKSRARLDTHRPVSIEEECEEEDEDHPDSAVSGIPPARGSCSTLKGSEFSPSSGYHEDIREPLAFEILPPRGHQHHHHHHQRSESRRRRVVVDMTKVRVKVHGEKDTRYVMITPSMSYVDFVEQIRKKFGLLCCGDGKTTGEFKLKMRDEEGDMVTMGDQEDLEMAVQACRDVLLASEAEDVQMGKMEVWVQEI